MSWKNHKSIKYYAVGEYGGKTLRPHYHMVIFNADVNLFERSWALENKTIGQIHVGTITEASIGYTLKYISKASKIPLHKNDDRQKEFSLMSKGLGSNYLTKTWYNGTKTTQKNVYVPLLTEKKRLCRAITKRRYSTNTRRKNSLSLSEESEFISRIISERTWQQSSIFPC